MGRREEEVVKGGAKSLCECDDGISMCSCPLNTVVVYVCVPACDTRACVRVCVCVRACVPLR